MCTKYSVSTEVWFFSSLKHQNCFNVDDRKVNPSFKSNYVLSSENNVLITTSIQLSNPTILIHCRNESFERGVLF